MHILRMKKWIDNNKCFLQISILWCSVKCPCADLNFLHISFQITSNYHKEEDKKKKSYWKAQCNSNLNTNISRNWKQFLTENNMPSMFFPRILLPFYVFLGGIYKYILNAHFACNEILLDFRKRILRRKSVSLDKLTF